MGLSRRKIDNYLLLFAGLFVAYMLFLTTQAVPYIGYSYYWDRYYLTEVIPFSLIIIAVFLSTPKSKSNFFEFVKGGSILFIAVYFAFFSISLKGKIEGSDPEFFFEVDRSVGSGDLLFFDKSAMVRPDHIKTPLIYYFNKKVFPLRTEADLSKREIQQLAAHHGSIFLLSQKKYSDVNIELIKRLKYREGFFVAGNHAWAQEVTPASTHFLLPFRHYRFEHDVYLYKITNLNKLQRLFSPNLGLDQIISFQKGGNSEKYTVSGWSQPESNFTWTDGKSSELRIKITPTTEPLMLEAKLAPLVLGKINSQVARIYLNDHNICVWHVTELATYQCDIPSSVSKNCKTLNFRFEISNPIRPIELGVQDSRMLGLQFGYLRLLVRQAH